MVRGRTAEKASHEGLEGPRMGVGPFLVFSRRPLERKRPPATPSPSRRTRSLPLWQVPGARTCHSVQPAWPLEGGRRGVPDRGIRGVRKSKKTMPIDGGWRGT